MAQGGAVAEDQTILGEPRLSALKRPGISAYTGVLSGRKHPPVHGDPAIRESVFHDAKTRSIPQSMPSQRRWCFAEDYPD